MILLALLLLAAPVRVGSKQFTESVILGEIVRQALERDGIPAVHERELGGTRVVFEALAQGQIDVYPEYTGTIAQELVPGRPIEEGLRARGLRMGAPLGFEDTYAIGVRRAVAERLGLRTLGDLARHPEVRLGLSNEFLQRADGWPRLQAVYGFAGAGVRGLQHDLAYRALQDGSLDATDLYSTDAEIRALGLTVLADDRHAFPDYRAVLLHRANLPAQALRSLERLAGTISTDAMIGMNARARLDHVPEAEVAAAFLGAPAEHREGWPSRVLRRTGEHLFLVGISLGAAVLVAIPLGVLAARRRRLGQAVLGAAGLLQTIPSLALLVFMIPLLGIGARPAIAALFLYSLLPIVRSTHAGLLGIAPDLRESAAALGLTPWARLHLVELPMASRSILSGIQTSAVINVGTATLGALIGAGGYGQPILTGIRLADTGIILEGAVPAALLALLAQALFGALERAVVPKGLR
ncbi:MAG TPA: glycine betaine ABC transporter substrate-binding protein [Myxococcales bacterium]|nr:glycine betaine ABC transporter substrate-binding protein [Myxococcales bacterium]